MGSSKSHDRAQASKESHCSELLELFDAEGEAFVPNRHR